MYKRAQNRQVGFTVIEVMIVLAIAGVIMMLLFLVVPTLQRNNRNTQIRNDAAALIGYANDYATNKNGALPTTMSYTAANNGEVQGSDGTTDISLGKIRADLTLQNQNGTQGALAVDGTATGTLRYVKDAKCNDDGSTTLQRRSVAVQYVVETGGGDLAQCQQS